MILNKKTFFYKHPSFGCYIFVPGSNSFLKTNEKCHNALKLGDFSTFNDAELKVLQKYNLIDSSQKKNQTISLGLKVTSACNLNCEFCSQKNIPVKKQLMDWNTAKASVDKFLSVSSKKYKIGFFGGEPLLNFDLIEKALAYVHRIKADKDVMFHLNTNGSFLQKFGEYLDSEDIVVSVSLEGPRSYYNGNEGHFDAISDSISKFKNRDNLLINIVVTSENIDTIPDLLCEMKDVGNFALCIPSFNLSTLWTSSGEDMAKKIFNLFAHAKTIGVLLVFSNWAFWKDGTANCSSLAGEGVFVTQTGECSVCHSVPNILGNVHDMSFRELCNTSKNLPLELKNNIELCKKCDIYHFCKGGCLADKKDTRGEHSKFCVFAKSFFKLYVNETIENGNVITNHTE